MKTAAVIPVKRLGSAKQRLSGGLTQEQRRDLMAAMFTDTLAAVEESRMIDIVIVVTGDPELGRIAVAAGAELVVDPPEAGHAGAAVLGADRAVERYPTLETVVLLPGDCPLLEPRELDSLLTGLPSPFVAVVPDRHGTGTNALVLSPPDVIYPAFGEGSCQRHVDLARKAGVPQAVEPLPSLGLDLDTPADIVALATRLDDGGAGERGRNTARVLGL